MNIPHSLSKLWQSGIGILEDNICEKKLLPEGSIITEKRRDPRVSVTVPLKFKVKNAQKWDSVESIDVSNSGVRLSLSHDVPVGSQIELEVCLPNYDKEIKLDGTVMWVNAVKRKENGFECGIAFQNLRQVTKKDKLISFIADQLCSVALKQASTGLSAQPAKDFEDLKRAYHLIYKEYVARGYCQEHPSHMYYNLYSLLPDSRTFILKQEELLLGTVSLIRDSSFGLPLEKLFSEPVQNLREKGAKLAEVGLLSLNQEVFKKKSFSLTDFQKLTGSFKLFKILFDYADYTGVTDLLIAVHPKHEELYRYLTFEIIAPPLPFESVCGKPALPMKLNIEKARTALPPEKSLVKFFFGQKTPVELLSHKMPYDLEMLKSLIFETRKIWNELAQEEQKQLLEYYPELANIKSVLRAKKNT